MASGEFSRSNLLHFSLFGDGFQNKALFFRKLVHQIFISKGGEINYIVDRRL